MSSAQVGYRLLADALLVVHFAYVAFVVVGLLLTWIGYFARWSFVRNFWFRAIHLLSIGIVLTEALGGVMCPLTVWEDELRVRAGDDAQNAGSFLQHWIHRVMFFELSESTFTVIYAAFFLAIASSFWYVRPRWPWRSPARGD